jgi:hypothetical protein
MPFLKGEAKESPRPGFLYWSDEGDLMALRYGNWKVHFMEQRSDGMEVWQEPFVSLRLPKLVNLRTDPFENADIAANMFYAQWRVDASSCCCRPERWSGSGSVRWLSSRQDNGLSIGVSGTYSKSSSRTHTHSMRRRVSG